MIVVTGASGQLGRLVVQGLLKKVPAGEIVAAVRNAAKAEDLAGLGVQVREADYDRPKTLETAFAGADTVLLISSNEVVHPVPQHKAVVDAAKKAGAGLLAYTSILRADTSRLALAAKHKATEEYIRASGVPFVFLRNGWYLENQMALGPALADGVIVGSAGEGRFAAAARADYADAAVAVLSGDGHANQVYELGGDEPYTLSQLAAEVTRQSGKNVVYHDLPKKEYAAALAGFGLPVALADKLADADAWAAKGELDSSSHTLSELIGQRTTTMAAAVRAALRT